jgi:hypothetical protein
MRQMMCVMGNSYRVFTRNPEEMAHLGVLGINARIRDQFEIKRSLCPFVLYMHIYIYIYIYIYGCRQLDHIWHGGGNSVT